MAVTLSLFAGAGAQFLDNNGVMLSGGLVYTYAAGTTTPLAAYTSNTGDTALANPIVLNASGRVPTGEIWLTYGQGYKFTVKTSTGTLIGTYDNIPSAALPPLVNNAVSIAYEQGASVTAGNFIIGQTYLITFIGTTNFQSIGAVSNTVGIYFTATGVGSGTGTAEVSRTVEAKLQETISVKDFGAIGDWNGTQTSPGTGTDDTLAIQDAIDYCVLNGAGLFFPPGRYRTTAPLVIDRSFNNEDPINGSMYGIALTGADPASCQIVSDHNGACIDFRGGAGAGWHTYFTFSGLGLLKSNYGRNVGSIGLKMDQSVFFDINNFDFSFFEYGIYGTDCLSGSFSTGTIRLNNYGFKFLKGTRSHPNNISFRGIITLNNQIYGGYLVKPSVFNYIGGSIESNGYTGILADPNSWGLYVDQPGAEGSVGINLTGTYIENNNGKADVWIVATGATGVTTSMNTFTGCSFLRFSDLRYVTNNILLDGANPSKVSISGCGFKDYSSYVSDATRLWVATGNAQVYDGGGNIFSDTAGGFVGMSKSVFAPIAAHHQLPFASLPTPSLFPNGIQYCADGGGGTSRAAIAVSDGTKWWQIVLGQFGGSVQSGGTANTLPRNWTVSKTGTGIYTVVHNLAITGTQYAVVATPTGAPGQGYSSGMVKSSNSFEIYFANTAGAAADMAFDFTLSVI